MKCPLTQGYIQISEEEESYAVHDCLKEECAWWDANGDRCGVLEIPRLLQAIGHTLGQLESKIPPGGQE